MTSATNDPALYGAIHWFALDCYPRFDALGREKAAEAAQACSAWMMTQPLCRGADGEFPKRNIPHLGERSIVYAAAVMAAFLVWRCKGNTGQGSNAFIVPAADAYRIHQRSVRLAQGESLEL